MPTPRFDPVRVDVSGRTENMLRLLSLFVITSYERETFPAGRRRRIPPRTPRAIHTPERRVRLKRFPTLVRATAPFNSDVWSQLKYDQNSPTYALPTFRHQHLHEFWRVQIDATRLSVKTAYLRRILAFRASARKFAHCDLILDRVHKIYLSSVCHADH